MIELMVVLLIVALLSGILLSGVQNARRDHRQFQCMSNLRMIHTGLSMYRLDWLGYPPFDLNEAQQYATETPTLAPDAATSQNIPTWSSGTPAHPTGLWILAAVTGNIDSPHNLHCPEGYDLYSEDGSGPVLIAESAGTGETRVYESWFGSWFFNSYQNYDPDAQAWQYQPLRDTAVVAGPDYRRQLWDARLDWITAGGDAICAGLQRYGPSGDAIMAWCPHHRKDNTDENRLERTLVLFADGNVEVKDRFVDWAAVPANEAWTFPRSDPNWW